MQRFFGSRMNAAIVDLKRGCLLSHEQVGLLEDVLDDHVSCDTDSSCWGGGGRDGLRIYHLFFASKI